MRYGKQVRKARKIIKQDDLLLSNLSIDESALISSLKYLFNASKPELAAKFTDNSMCVDSVQATLGLDSIILLAKTFNIDTEVLTKALLKGYSLVDILLLNNTSSSFISLDSANTSQGFNFKVNGTLLYFTSGVDFINYLGKLFNRKTSKYVDMFNEFIMMGCDLSEAREHIFFLMTGVSDKRFRICNSDTGHTPAWFSYNELYMYLGIELNIQKSAILSKIKTRFIKEYLSCIDSIKSNKSLGETRYVHLGFGEYIRRLKRESNVIYNGVLYSSELELCEKNNVDFDEFRKYKIYYENIGLTMQAILDTDGRRGLLG